MRKAIVHYHFYKNAGTSIDRILQDSFGEKWISCDVKDIKLTDDIIEKFHIYNKNINQNTRMSPKVLEAILEHYKDKIAFSAHQLIFPLPKCEIKIYPIFFLRHPIDRLISGFLFETQHNGELSTIDKNKLQNYISSKYSSPGTNPFDNFHALRLGNADYFVPGAVSTLTPEQIILNCKTFLSEMSFFGIVEYFDESLKRMSNYLLQDFPSIRIKNYWLNKSQRNTLSIEEKISRIKEIIGEDTYRFLAECNSLDMEIYEFALDVFFKKVDLERA
ncbi:MAG: sulfotransferase family 2 domain-containing protein [Desulfobulbaceae bacterium]|nr:sulfotransferase family 2 domain-containing protein [Desulfobulbaceae bacterium]